MAAGVNVPPSESAQSVGKRVNRQIASDRAKQGPGPSLGYKTNAAKEITGGSTLLHPQQFSSPSQAMAKAKQTMRSHIMTTNALKKL